MPFGLADFHLTFRSFLFCPQLLFSSFFLPFCFASLLLFCFHCGSRHAVVVVLGNSIFCHGFWANFKWLTYIYLSMQQRQHGCQWIPLAKRVSCNHFMHNLFGFYFYFAALLTFSARHSIGSQKEKGQSTFNITARWVNLPRGGWRRIGLPTHCKVFAETSKNWNYLVCLLA